MWAARPTRFAIIKIMRTWGSSGAAEAIRRAQAVSRVARQAGCDLDEARAVLAGQLSRRGFLATAGAAGVAGLGAAPAPTVTPAVRGIPPRVVVVGAGIAGLG